MRDAVEFAQRTSGRGRGKVVLVYPAERMNTITANTLLKTLEEPPGDVRFVLASEAAHQLLPTIRSRCLGHTMRWPEPAEALAWLAGEGVRPPMPRRPAARRRRPARRRAAPARRAGLDAKQWSRLPKAIAAARWRRWATSRRPRPSTSCRSSATTWSPCAPAPSRGSSRPATCRRRPAGPPWGVVAKELGREQRTVEHPFNAGLMLESLVSRARSALHSAR
jgi:DNA polymerase-3 subunit delta'